MDFYNFLSGLAAVFSVATVVIYSKTCKRLEARRAAAAESEQRQYLAMLRWKNIAEIAETTAPFRPFHPQLVKEPAKVLAGRSEDPAIRAIMQLLELECARKVSDAGDEAVQQFPGMAAKRAGAMMALMAFHGVINKAVKADGNGEGGAEDDD